MNMSMCLCAVYMSMCCKPKLRETTQTALVIIYTGSINNHKQLSLQK